MNKFPKMNKLVPNSSLIRSKQGLVQTPRSKRTHEKSRLRTQMRMFRISLALIREVLGKNLML